MKLIRKSELTTANWAHGTTTQLYIFPASATYKELNFDYRISTATVEAETTKFSNLKGVKRTLMVLEGTLELEHKGHHSTILNPLETDSFMGDWETNSGGKVTDFNVMVRDEKLNAHVKPILFGKNNTLNLEAENIGFVYLLKGKINLNDLDELVPGDSFHFDSNDVISLKATTNATLIHVTIK